MSDAVAVDRLRAFAFAGLDEASLERLLDKKSARGRGEEHARVQARKTGTGLYVVVDGTVAVEYRDTSIELGPGEFFGELSLLVEDAPRSAGCARSRRCSALLSAARKFEELLENEPTVALTMLRTLARRFAARSTAPDRLLRRRVGVPMALCLFPRRRGWSGQVARRAHNPEVAGSILPATRKGPAGRALFRSTGVPRRGGFLHVPAPEQRATRRPTHVLGCSRVVRVPFRWAGRSGHEDRRECQPPVRVPVPGRWCR